VSDSTDPWPTLNEPTVYQEPNTTVAPPPRPDAGPPPDRRIGAGMLLGILAVLIAAGGVFLAWYLSHHDRTTTEVTTVVTTAPTAGTSTPATGRIAVPRVIGLTQRQAVAELKLVGFTPVVTSNPSSRPSGTVLAQTPAEEVHAAKGTTVRIVVARASSAATTAPTTTAPTTTTAAPPTPQTAQVPDVGGQTEPAASLALTHAGIRPSFVFVPSGEPLGTVVGQAKSSGSTVSDGAHMQVNLSQGPHMQASAMVPNVVGQTLASAVSTLNGVRLRLIFVKQPVNSQANVGTISQQTPDAGAHIPQNAQVLVFLAVYRPGG
jgi:beta-lactam-binding protein with PASTA domain